MSRDDNRGQRVSSAIFGQVLAHVRKEAVGPERHSPAPSHSALRVDLGQADENRKSSRISARYTRSIPKHSEPVVIRPSPRRRRTRNLLAGAERPSTDIGNHHVVGKNVPRKCQRKRSRRTIPVNSEGGKCLQVALWCVCVTKRFHRACKHVQQDHAPSCTTKHIQTHPDTSAHDHAPHCSRNTELTLPRPSGGCAAPETRRMPTVPSAC